MATNDFTTIMEWPHISWWYYLLAAIIIIIIILIIGIKKRKTSEYEERGTHPIPDSNDEQSKKPRVKEEVRGKREKEEEEDSGSGSHLSSIVGILLGLSIVVIVGFTIVLPVVTQTLNESTYSNITAINGATSSISTILNLIPLLVIVSIVIGIVNVMRFRY